MMIHTITKELIINASPERVFRALTEKSELERWYVKRADIDARPGGAIRLEWSPEIVEHGTIVALEPPHRLSYTWEALEPTPTTITFDLSEEHDGTHLHFTHADIGDGEQWGNYYSGIGSGWDVHLKHLAAWLESGTCDTPGPTGSIRGASQ